MRVPRIVLTLATVIAVAACSSDPAPTAHLTQPDAPCPAVDSMAGHRTAEPLPADFQPVSVVQCTFRLAVDRSAPSPSSGVAWVAAQRSTGPFGDLVRTLRLPPHEQDGEPVCTAIMIMPTLLALTDASGRTLVPALPGTACGSPRAEIRAALDALTWTEIARAE